MRPENPREHIAQLVAGKIAVPLSEMPLIENGVLAGWKPATVSKPDGSLWLVAFTTPELASAFCDRDPDYGFYIDVETRWALRAMPEQHGIVFDLGTEQMFQWNAQGLAKYKKDVLGWE